MPFAEYNSSRYMTDEMQKLGEITFDENAVTVGLFGEKISVENKDIANVFETLTPFLPNEIKFSAELVQLVAEYIGEAQ